MILSTLQLPSFYKLKEKHICKLWQRKSNREVKYKKIKRPINQWVKQFLE